METPPQIIFHGIDPSDFVERRVRDEIDKLEKYFDRITSCRVTIEAPHKHSTKGNLYAVKVFLEVPGHSIAVQRAPDQHQAHQDVYVAIRDAFREATRQLKETVRKLQGNIKSHDEAPRGRIVRMFPQDGYGFIKTLDGREVYFHENSVIDTEFMGLEVGQVVEYHEVQGVEGPQASTVRTT